MVLYLDVIWLLNFLIDSILLMMTALFLKRHLRWWRIFSGGFIGSLIVLLSFTPYAHISGHPLAKLSFSIIMVLAAFGFKRFRFFIGNLLMLYFSTFLTGGILIGVHYFLSFDNNLQSSMFLASVKGFGDPISWVFVMFALPSAWYFSRSRVSSIETVNIQYDQLVNIEVEINGLKLGLKGLVDSGNQLYDPLSKSPVMLISSRGLEEAVPEEILQLSEDNEDMMSGNHSLSPEWEDRVRFIPAQSVGKKSQLLIAFKPDTIVIKKGEQTWPCKKGLIVFQNMEFSADGTFNSIVHPRMMTAPPLRNVS
ncbi:sigma-E processing peptidase SpoIIGA [Bacillus salacetis]|uniref:Sporulation sigma-E factor-processing peptidase n=1 Tax=Bacillus salacetis TaxID=2315464 RepID=A0A3A1R7R2_9BACI|nr:sigma-E processing peptidase SpoIIGA [Bacillus salacetis]RIW36329.1 sigma-E processing peptidase SpoIIGA [Bacillus salacetis]